MKHRRRRRPLRWCLALFGVMIAVVLTLTAVFFVWPSTNAPRRSDAIVVLGGSGPRLQKGLALARAGYAPYLAGLGWRSHGVPIGITRNPGDLLFPAP